MRALLERLSVLDLLLPICMLAMILGFFLVLALIAAAHVAKFVGGC